MVIPQLVAWFRVGFGILHDFVLNLQKSNFSTTGLETRQQLESQGSNRFTNLFQSMEYLLAAICQNN
jgi:hypothetical protein